MWGKLLIQQQTRIKLLNAWFNRYKFFYRLGGGWVSWIVAMKGNWGPIPLLMRSLLETQQKQEGGNKTMMKWLTMNNDEMFNYENHDEMAKPITIHFYGASILSVVWIEKHILSTNLVLFIVLWSMTSKSMYIFTPITCIFHEGIYVNANVALCRLHA